MTVKHLSTEQRQHLISGYVDRMPSLSTTVTKVLEVCNSPSAAPNDLNRVIALDPVLTGQVLKLINSAYYSMPNQITSLTRAIIMLGINTVKNLALSTAVIGTIAKSDSFKSLPMDAFWTHSICVGVTAKALAEFRGVKISEREEYFVAGMLHDLGKIPLNNCFPKEYKQALELADLEQGPLRRAETMVMGLDHCLAGRLIGEKWQLTQNLVEILSHHHKPEEASANYRELVATVSLANCYANVYEFGSAGDHFQDSASLYDSLKLMGMSWADLANIKDKVESEIAKAQVFLQIAK